MLSPTIVEWEVAGDCMAPVRFSKLGRDTGKQGFRANVFTRLGQVSYGHDAKAPIEVVFETRCRKCPACKRAKKRMWSVRAEIETRRATRTWFGTLTFKPDYLFRAKLIAEAKALSRHTLPSELTEEERFTAMVAVCGREVTLMLKRLRERELTRAVRYLLVAEAHKSGNPHFHMLLHEYGTPITKRELDLQWYPHGFCMWRLVPKGIEVENTELRSAVRYVCKYLAKSTRARVRASGGYGNTSLDKDVLENIVKFVLTPALSASSVASADQGEGAGEMPSPARRSAPGAVVQAESKGLSTSGLSKRVVR